MYGKLFSQMYDGTLGTEGPWQALVTFQQLIVLADKNGVVDMTAEAIARRTTIPLDVVRVGIVSLEQPDKSSRTPDEEGRRIVRLADNRDWGWRIVNYEKYRTLRSEEDRREYHRAYWHKRKLKATADTQHDSTNSTQSTKAVSSKQKQVKTNAFALPDWIPEEDWLAFAEMRTKNKSGMTDHAKNLIIADLAKIKESGNDPIAALRKSTAHGWKGVLFEKSKPADAPRKLAI